MKAKNQPVSRTPVLTEYKRQADTAIQDRSRYRKEAWSDRTHYPYRTSYEGGGRRDMIYNIYIKSSQKISKYTQYKNITEQYYTSTNGLTNSFVNENKGRPSLLY